MAYTAKPAALPTWATSSGSTIVGSLTATDAEYQSTTTVSGVTYGLIKYSFSGSPTLSSVLAGHFLVVDGFTNSENNGTFYITAADDSTDEITVRSAVRTSASLDETGVSLAGNSVTDAGALIYTPSTLKQAQGWVAPEKPADGHFNWWQNTAYHWMNQYNNNTPDYYLIGEKLTAGTGVTIADNDIVTSLVVTDVDWQSNESHGGSTNGIIRYTFSGSPVLSGVAANDVLVVTGCSNSSNNGSFEIKTVDDGSDTIDVYSTARTDDTDDETGITGAADAHDGTKLITSPGTVKQIQMSQSATVASATAVVPQDNTIPQVSEMTAYASLDTSITPLDSSNILIIEVDIAAAGSLSGTFGDVMVGALFQDSDTDALIARNCQFEDQDDSSGSFTFTFKMTAGTTSATTFKFYFGVQDSGDVAYINRTENDSALYGGVLLSTLKITEYAN